MSEAERPAPLGTTYKQPSTQGHRARRREGWTLLDKSRRLALDLGVRCPDCDRQGTWDQDLAAVICDTCGQCLGGRFVRRAALCGTKSIAENGSVKLAIVGVRREGRRAALVGVYRCNKGWECPDCASRIAAKDRDTLHRCNLGWRGYVPKDPTKVLGEWTRDRSIAEITVKGHRRRRGYTARDGHVYLLTLTVPHHRGQALEPMRRAITAAYDAVHNTAAYRRRGRKRRGVPVPVRCGLKVRYGIRCSVRRLEVTHGPEGWHPHIHALLFTDRKLSPEDIESIREWYFTHWAAAIEKAGYKRPTKEAGVDLQAADRGGRYLAKMGLELAGDGIKLARCRRCSDYKETVWRDEHRCCVDCGQEANRTPWQLLHDLADHGSPRDKRLWRKYLHDISGARRLTWTQDSIAPKGSPKVTLRERYAEHVRVPEKARCACPVKDCDHEACTRRCVGHGPRPECERCNGTGRYMRHRLVKLRRQVDAGLEHVLALEIPAEAWDLWLSRDPQGRAEVIEAYEDGDTHALDALLGKWAPQARLPPVLPDGEQPQDPVDDDATMKGPAHMGLVLSPEELAELRN